MMPPRLRPPILLNLAKPCLTWLHLARERTRLGLAGLGWLGWAQLCSSEFGWVWGSAGWTRLCSAGLGWSLESH